jgi:asparagine synthase (glutamine-hydrolysing)
MCGILAIIGKGKDAELVKELSKGCHTVLNESDLHVMENGSILSHERLSIIDLHSGKQPIQGRYYMWFIMVRFTIIKN